MYKKIKYVHRISSSELETRIHWSDVFTFYSTSPSFYYNNNNLQYVLFTTCPSDIEAIGTVDGHLISSNNSTARIALSPSFVATDNPSVGQTTTEDEEDNVNLYQSYFILIYRNEDSKVDCLSTQSKKKKDIFTGSCGKKKQTQKKQKNGKRRSGAKKQAIFEVWFVYLFFVLCVQWLFNQSNVNLDHFAVKHFTWFGVRERRKKKEKRRCINMDQFAQMNKTYPYLQRKETNASDNGNIMCLQSHNIKLFKDASKVDGVKLDSLQTINILVSIAFTCICDMLYVAPNVTYTSDTQIGDISTSVENITTMDTAVRSIIVSFFDTKELYYRCEQDWNEI
ncbi:hypothetical protein RFI_26891, partial [Reticulomyxa filosa]